MKEFKIEDTIRYLITGVWIFFLLNQHNILPKIINFDKEFLVIVISFAIGALAYSVFRTLINPWLQRVLDWIIISNNTGRNYIKKRFGIKCWDTRNDLWVLFHQTYSKKFPGNYTIWLSTFLTMYILSISTLITFACGYYHCHHEYIYLVIGVFLFVCSVFSNNNYEKRFFNNAIMISDPSFNEFIEEYLKTKKEYL